MTLAVVNAVVAVVDSLYSGYGDGAPRGQRPDTGFNSREGQ
jgi:hypothetical protein